MEQKQEPQRPKIGTEEVRRAADILRRYHAGKRQLEQRIIDNEQFWKLRHWQQMEKAGQGGNPADPQPTSGWLVNCILSKHADAMDCYPEPTVLPREPGDREEARKLTRILPVVLKKNGFKRTYSSAWWYKLKSGCAVYGVFWDAGKLNGLGDIAIRRMDLLNLFWEPGVTDIQDSPHFFSTELQDREALEERYPWAKGKADRGGWSVSRYLYDDAVDTSGKVLVVDWYYHTREHGRKVLQYCKFVGDTVLYATENDPDMREKGWYDHGKYPFVFDVLFPEEGTPAGYGYVDLCKSPQKQIDLMNQAILKNTTVSDLLDLTAIDDVVLEITDRHGSNMGLTLDTVTRNEIQQGSQVIYAPKLGADGGQTAVLHRYDLTEGCKLTSELVAKAATQLKKMNAPTFEGKYVCILHPSVAFDLRQDPAWVAAHQYAAATELFSGEIGELHGVRFVETTEAKIFRGDDLAKNSRTLSVNGKVENAAAVGFDGGTVAANALKGRYVLVGGKRCKVVGNTASQLTLDTAVTAADNDVIYPGEGGSQGCAVYGCLFLGKGAYGVVDLSEGTEVIVKPRGSSGTADPLDQRSSVGWKGIHAAAILYDEYIVRVECGSSYSGEDKAN